VTQTGSEAASGSSAAAQPATGDAAGSPVAAAAPSAARPAIVIPEPLSYRLKKALLGPPLVTERLSTERLGKPTALGVLSPDCISSTAYGPEEILYELVRAIGVAAFSLLLPLTFAVIVVLLFVTLSYREVVMVYTKAGGSYVVARDNFGVKVAQIAAVALIIDYIVTVAVQVAAGTDAVTSAFPSLVPYAVPLSVGVVLVMTYGNLRGLREAGRMFAVPTYLFVVSTGLVIVIGLVRAALGQLHAHAINLPGAVPAGHPTSGLFYGASIIVVLRAFANGGSSLTGLEAISNGVATFRPPEGRNARRVLVIMATILGCLVLGVALIAHITHAVPFLNGSPTVLSQEARDVFGSSIIGRIGFYFVQGATMLILYTGGNTSFNGFPNLASFVAQDAFLPRQLTRRGHRLVFSNGILILSAAAILLLVVTRAQVAILVGVYAVGVFTGFTMAGAGMVKHHLRFRERGWRYKLVINGFAAVLSFVVVAIFVVAKFAEGVWIVVVLFVLLVPLLIRLHHQYTVEKEELEANAARAAEMPILRRHVVLVFVERLDLAAARALQYARTLNPDELRAVHFVLDQAVAQELEDSWANLGLARFPLDLLECPDRRLTRAAMELVAEQASDGETEVSVLLPRRVFEGLWRKVLHDRTADRIASFVSQIPHANATIVPYALGKRKVRVATVPPGEPLSPEAVAIADQATSRALEAGVKTAATLAAELDGSLKVALPPGTVPIGSLRWRQRAQVAGRVRSVRVQPRAGVPSLECVLADATGQLLLVFQGRRRVPGIEPGARLLVEGMVGERGRRTAMINPLYRILSGAPTSPGDDEGRD